MSDSSEVDTSKETVITVGHDGVNIDEPAHTLVEEVKECDEKTQSIFIGSEREQQLAIQLREWINAREKPLSTSDAIVLIAKTMELVEGVSGLKGAEKHRFALNVLSIVGQEHGVNEELIKTCITLADSTMPLLVQWAKGNTVVNAATARVKKCCNLL